MAEEVREQWVMKFDGSSTTHFGGVGVVMYYEEDKVVALSFKLEFPCSNNTAEYEAYLTELATALKRESNISEYWEIRTWLSAKPKEAFP